MRTHILILIALAGFVSQPALANNFKYKIIYPDNEEKVFVFTDNRTELKLRGSKWRCAVTMEETKVLEDGAILNRATISCFQSAGPQMIAVPLVCIGKSQDVTALQLYEGNKLQKVHIIKLGCNGAF